MIKKVEDEENRYSKAYGAGTLEFKQFQNLMKEAKYTMGDLPNDVRTHYVTSRHEVSIFV